MLNKVIKSCMIKNEYKAFVDQFHERLSKAIGQNLHSLYICGSIPKGKAEPYKSDADFTIVCNTLNHKINMDVVNKIKSDLLIEYPFITKIDTTFISVNDVKTKALEWGFWLKVICYCIHGKDLGEEVGPLKADSALIVSLLSEFKEVITRLNLKLNKTTDKDELNKTIRAYSKRLIRSLYTLILEDVQEWQDDILDMKNALGIYMSDKKELIDFLYNYYREPQSDKVAFQTCADQASHIIYKRLEVLSKQV